MSCKCLMLNCHYFLFSPKSYCKFLCLHYFLLSAFQLWIQWAPRLSHSKSFNACSCTGTVIIKVLISIVLVFYKTCFWTNTKADQFFYVVVKVSGATGPSTLNCQRHYETDHPDWVSVMIFSIHFYNITALHYVLLR